MYPEGSSERSYDACEATERLAEKVNGGLRFAFLLVDGGGPVVFGAGSGECEQGEVGRRGERGREDGHQRRVPACSGARSEPLVYHFDDSAWYTPQSLP